MLDQTVWFPISSFTTVWLPDFPDTEASSRAHKIPLANMRHWREVHSPFDARSDGRTVSSAWKRMRKFGQSWREIMWIQYTKPTYNSAKTNSLVFSLFWSQVALKKLVKVITLSCKAKSSHGQVAYWRTRSDSICFLVRWCYNQLTLRFVSWQLCNLCSIVPFSSANAFHKFREQIGLTNLKYEQSKASYACFASLGASSI